MANNSIIEQINHDTFGAAILVHRSPWMGVCFGRERGVFDLFWVLFLIKNVLE